MGDKPITIEYRLDGGWGIGSPRVRSFKLFKSNDGKVLKFEIGFEEPVECFHIEISQNSVWFKYCPVNSKVGADWIDLGVRTSVKIGGGYCLRKGGGSSLFWENVVDLGIDYGASQLLSDDFLGFKPI